MTFDIKTITMILGLTHLMQILVFYHQFKVNKTVKGPGWWLLWSATEFVAFILILLRYFSVLVPFIIVFQDILIIAGTFFIYIGVMHFFNQKVNLKLILPLFSGFVILHLFFFMILENIVLRALLFDFYLIIIAIITAFALIRYKTKSIAVSINFNVAILVIHAVIFLYRSIILITAPVKIDIFAQSFFNFIQYFDALIVSLLWTFGFILMINHRLNAEISEAKLHFEEIFNTSPDAALITRLGDGFLVDCNENFTNITGYNKYDIKDKSSLDIHIWNNPADRMETIRIVQEKGYVENHEFEFKRKNGEIFPGLVSAKKIELNGIPHLISVTKDISELKSVQEEIKTKNVALQNLNAIKDKLFSIIAHDLRGPLTTIIGYADILSEDIENYQIDEIRNKLVLINNSARQTDILLQNLLNWARTQIGQEINEFELIDINGLIEEVINFFKIQASAKKIKIYNSNQLNRPIYSELNILNTVLRNLISNSVKFTYPGGKIEVRVIDKTDNIQISVSDNGMGIPEEVKKELFSKKIHQSHRGTMQEKGTGLGMSICKDMVEKIGGLIWVESKVGEGSTFYFTVPE